MEQRLPPASRGLNLRLFLLSGVFWCAYGSYFSFLVMYLTGIGYSAAFGGTVIAVLAAANMAVLPLSGHLCDTRIPLKRFFLCGTALGIPASLLLPLVSGRPALIFPVILLMTLCVYQMPAIADAWVVGLTRRYSGISYGLVRGGGSLFFGVGSLVFGRLYASLGLQLMFPCTAALLALLLLIAWTTEAPPPPVRSRPEEGSSIGLLFSNRVYLTLVLSVALLYTAVCSFDTVLPAAIRALGGDSGDMGGSYFLGLFTEVPMMFLAGRLLRRAGARRVILASGAVYILRMLWALLAAGIPALVSSHLLNGLGYGLYQVSVMALIAAHVPARQRSAAITIHFAVGNGLGGIVGNFFGGQIVDLWGPDTAFFCAVVLSALSLIVLAVGLHSLPRTPQADPS